eukprot:366327-Chlamydomonas_euryale.AAC.11
MMWGRPSQTFALSCNRGKLCLASAGKSPCLGARAMQPLGSRRDFEGVRGSHREAGMHRMRSVNLRHCRHVHEALQRRAGLATAWNGNARVRCERLRR